MEDIVSVRVSMERSDRQKLYVQARARKLNFSEWVLIVLRNVARGGPLTPDKRCDECQIEARKANVCRK